MKKDEIRNANRKVLPKFLLALAVCMIVSGVAGYCSIKYGLDQMAGTIRDAGAFFGMHIAPWLMVAIAAALPAACVPFYRRAKKLLDTWDGEDEDISDEIDGKLSSAIWISSALLVFSYFLIAASYSGGFATFDSKENTIVFCVAIAAFLVVMIEMVVIQQKCVDAAKQTNPEKKASIYDMRFQKKWMEDCDEAEKIMIGKCAYKAYTATNTVCTILAIVLAVCALVFNIGFCPRWWYAMSGSSTCRCTARKPCGIPRPEIKSPEHKSGGT